MLCYYICLLWFSIFSVNKKKHYIFVVSVDELENVLRVQELQLSTSLMNAKLRANLSAKLAAAEVQEADQKKAEGNQFNISHP
jgi:hypothetical protein